MRSNESFQYSARYRTVEQNIYKKNYYVLSTSLFRERYCSLINCPGLEMFHQNLKTKLIKPLHLVSML